MEQKIDPRDARIAELEADRAEAYRRLADEKLRADQMTDQHRMQCNMRQECEDVLDAARDHIRDLEAQLSAIGAGGVESLRKREAVPQGEKVYAALPERDGDNGYGDDLWDAESMRAFADATAALRSAPAADAREES